jgi:hypothetical protein
MTHILPATLETTQWGWFDNSQPPVLRVNAGDTVVLETMMHSHNQVIPGTTIEAIKKLRTDHPGRGPHTMTGPIFVEGAEPGDVLTVKINKIVPRAYATNFNVPGMFGQFPKGVRGRTGQIFLSRPRSQGRRVRARHRNSAQTLSPARPRSRAAEPGRYSTVPPDLTRQYGHPRLHCGHDAVRAGVRQRRRCCGPATRMPRRATAKST